jgi:hypothetical protein
MAILYEIGSIKLTSPILYEYLVTWDTDLIAACQYSAVDQADRHDLSIFRIAFDTLQCALVSGFKLFSR